mmetsp:Transcript_152421/g.280500  ORF Transcript_152421/g.280500 Transcript_152421/m.280500 type:complete len:214 (-) Transcript_152421:381-1022(-)
MNDHLAKSITLKHCADAVAHITGHFTRIYAKSLTLHDVFLNIIEAPQHRIWSLSALPGIIWRQVFSRCLPNIWHAEPVRLLALHQICVCIRTEGIQESQQPRLVCSSCILLRLLLIGGKKHLFVARCANGQTNRICGNFVNLHAPCPPPLIRSLKSICEKDGHWQCHKLMNRRRHFDPRNFAWSKFCYAGSNYPRTCTRNRRYHRPGSLCFKA